MSGFSSEKYKKQLNKELRVLKEENRTLKAKKKKRSLFDWLFRRNK